MTGAAPQKSMELVLLEEVRADVKDIRQSLTRVDRENLILRTRFNRVATDVAEQGKTIKEHERKINYAMGGSMVVGFLIGFLVKYWEKVKTAFM